jgi:hypothetical protein
LRGNKRWKRETHKRKKKIQTPRPISSRRKRVNRKRAGRKGSFKKIKWRRKQEGGITTNTKERKKERKIASLLIYNPCVQTLVFLGKVF